ncbi:hypothetical protein CYY_003697 [Polysphondylium violaceum]|uniref:BON domain-containing protein n=1 Tax=Polysphondylium violaceum TaxID=133409 RepID=A0A8J4UU34_9MYCE|nr:hypothetical protein CYY_003697 [Polysphondylium violaceum]
MNKLLIVSLILAVVCLSAVVNSEGQGSSTGPTTMWATDLSSTTTGVDHVSQSPATRPPATHGGHGSSSGNHNIGKEERYEFNRQYKETILSAFGIGIDARVETNIDVVSNIGIEVDAQAQVATGEIRAKVDAKAKVGNTKVNAKVDAKVKTA